MARHPALDFVEVNPGAIRLPQPFRVKLFEDTLAKRSEIQQAGLIERDLNIERPLKHERHQGDGAAVPRHQLDSQLLELEVLKAALDPLD